MKWWRRRPAACPTDAQKQIERAKRQQPEVNQLTRELREVRERNHFADMVNAALRGAR